MLRESMTWGREAGILQGASFVCWEDLFVSIIYVALIHFRILMRELHSCLTQKPPYIPILAISLLRRSEKISSLESRVQRPAMLDDAT